MKAHTKKALAFAAATLLLLNLAACSGAVGSGPDMADYSYVPPSKNATVITDPGIESY